MQTTFRVAKDSLTPDLRRMMKAVRDRDRLHRAIGLGLASLAKRAFRDPAMRPSRWAPKKDGSPATLRRSGTLAKGIAGGGNAARAWAGSDRRYAAIHQLGGRTRPHVIRPGPGVTALAFTIGGRKVFAKSVHHPGSLVPARPFLPFGPGARPTAEALRLVGEVVEARVRGRR